MSYKAYIFLPDISTVSLGEVKSILSDSFRDDERSVSIKNDDDKIVLLIEDWKCSIYQNADASVLEEAIELAENLEFLGFNLKTFNDWKATLAAQVLSHFAGIDESQVQHLITARLVARVAKNWNESDRIRDELDTMGVAIKDNKDGTTTWEVKR